MSRKEMVTLTNMCLIEDSKGRVVVQRRAPKRYSWSGLAFPGGDYVIIMIGAINAVKSRI